MMRVFSNRRILIFVVTIFFFFLVVVAIFTGFRSAGLKNDRDFLNMSFLTYENENSTLRAPHRKLLLRNKTESNPANSEPATDEPTRMWGEKCSRSDIVINQGPTSPLPTGIPTYSVEIMNVCVSGCDISGIHLTCGWFSSAHLVNPKVFKRLRYNDCLVNDGKTLLNGGTLSFQYANTFPYPFSVSAVVCT